MIQKRKERIDRGIKGQVRRHICPDILPGDAVRGDPANSPGDRPSSAPVGSPHILAESAHFHVADRVAVLDYGQLIADGKPSVVMQQDEVKQAYLGSEG